MCDQSINQTRGPFLERPGNFSGPKGNFKIQTSWIVSTVLAHKPVNFASSTDCFILLFSEWLKLCFAFAECKHNKHKTAFRARKVTGTFEKHAPGRFCLRAPQIKFFGLIFEWVCVKVYQIRSCEEISGGTHPKSGAILISVTCQRARVIPRQPPSSPGSSRFQTGGGFFPAAAILEKKRTQGRARWNDPRPAYWVAARVMCKGKNWHNLTCLLRSIGTDCYFFYFKK